MLPVGSTPVSTVGSVASSPSRFALAALLAGVSVAVGQATAFSPRFQGFGPFPYAGPDVPRRVALTFDDGPNEPYTSRLLDTLADRGVRATFFQVGRCAERFPEVTRRVVADGHVLGNHSYGHRARSYLTDPAQVDEISRGRHALRDVAGVDPLLYRPPWLCHWPWVLAGVRAGGAQVVSGTFVHPFEVLQPDPLRLTAGALRRARPGAILIAHDGREARGGPRAHTVAAVGPLIDRLRDQGYGFTTVDELLGVPAYAGTRAETRA